MDRIYEIDLNAPRHTQYMRNAWKRHEDTVYWVDINPAIEKGMTFYQTWSNAIILQETLPVYCIPKVVRMETGENIYQKVYVSSRSPPKISYKDNWIDLDSDIAGSSKETQNPIIKYGENRMWRERRKSRNVPSLIATAKIPNESNQNQKTIIKNGETRMWIRIHTKLRVDAYENWRRRSNKNGETREGGGARLWLQSTRTVACCCERSRTSPSSRACQKIESHLHRAALQADL